MANILDIYSFPREEVLRRRQEDPIKPHQRKQAVALELNINNLIAVAKKRGTGHLAFLTITFPPRISLSEAKERFTKMRGLLNELFPHRIYIWDLTDIRHPHVHAVVLTPFDSDDGFNTEAYQQCRRINEKAAKEKRSLSKEEKAQLRTQGKQLTSNNQLRSLWKRLRSSAKQLGLGRIELVPFFKTAKHVAGYMRERFLGSIRTTSRVPKGFRRLGYSRGDFREVWGNFAYANSPHRQKLMKIVKTLGYPDPETIRKYNGDPWGLYMSNTIDALDLRFDSPEEWMSTRFGRLRTTMD